MLFNQISGYPMLHQVVQSLSCVWLFATPWTAAHQASPSFTIYQNLLRFMSIESVMPSNHLILCHPFSSCLQSFPASGAFLMSWLFVSGGQSIGASASASVIPKIIKGLFPLLSLIIFISFIINNIYCFLYYYYPKIIQDWLIWSYSN